MEQTNNDPSSDFEPSSMQSADFYVCHQDASDEEHYQVPINASVQSALIDMFESTLVRIQELKNAEGFEEYSPAQKYGAQDAVYCQLDSDFAEIPRLLMQESDVPETSQALKDLEQVNYYYAKAFDSNGNKILGVRRAAQFKGVLKSKLVRVVDNTLKLVDEKSFRLDTDFDYIVFDDVLWALRPAGLEFTGDLTEAVKASAPAAASEIATRVSFLSLDSLATYASKHPRAARYLAAVKARSDLEQISQQRLTSYCAGADVQLVETDGKLSPAKGQEILFLEVLDRRLFTAELIEGQKERYEAPNRRNV
jgi:hypothetical protein